MILEYFGRLLLILPLIGGMAWGSLWLWKKLQIGLPLTAQSARAVRVVDAVSLGGNGRLLVVEFGQDTLLLGASRSGISLLASTDQGTHHA
jgi:flagellar protein FliO/FliZ